MGRISIWEPGRKLVFGFRGGNFSGNEITEVEVRFDSEDGGTRLTLDHSGWEVIPADHPVRHGLSEPEFWRMLGGWHAELKVYDMIVMIGQVPEGSEWMSTSASLYVYVEDIHENGMQTRSRTRWRY